jgi:NAD(P)H-dependent FMN reductase
MIVLISGTNRPGCNTLKVARIVEGFLRQAGAKVKFLNLQELPAGLLDPKSYAEKPPAFAAWQQAILEAEGILTVLPEYNGSYPGILKYFIDMLKFPESLQGMPAAFIGLGAGEWGGLRAVEQLEMVFNYRSAHLYGQRVFLKRINDLLDASGRLKDAAHLARLEAMATGFADFCRRVRQND